MAHWGEGRREGNPRYPGGTRKRRRSGSSPVRLRRLCLEALEDRRLLAMGDLDLSLDGDGKAITDFGGRSDLAYAVAVQSDGKIVVAGRSYNGANYDFALARYNGDGSLDTSFSGDGKVITDFGGDADWGFSVALQSDGRIVTAGYATTGGKIDFALARYNSDGSLDTSFDGDGKLTTALGSAADIARSVAVQSDGKIVVAGYSSNGSNHDFALVRYHADGSLDTSFDGDGKVITDLGALDNRLFSMALQSDGKIVVAGDSGIGNNQDFALARYNADGSLDTTFSDGGVVTTAFGEAQDIGDCIALQSDGKIVVAGFSSSGSNYDFALARYNVDGSLDTSFSGDGMLTTAFGASDDFAFGVAVQGDGKLVVAGYSTADDDYDFALVRYNSDGSWDGSFSGDGRLTTSFGGSRDTAYAVALQSDGKIVVAGSSGGEGTHDFALARYIGSSSPTAIALAPAVVAENQPAGSVVGTLTTVDPELPGDSHTYTLVSGTGSMDNEAFRIDGSQLKTDLMLDFETKSSYSIRVRTTDSGGFWYEEAFTVAVTDNNSDGLPVITSISPEVARVGQSVVIAGTGFSANPAANEVWFGGVRTQVLTANATALTVVDMFDSFSMTGFFGLQIHAGQSGSVAWRNIRVKDLGVSQWEPFFVKGGPNSKYQLAGAKFVLPEEWSFTEDGVLHGKHSKDQKNDGLVISSKDYDNFVARVTYRMHGGNSALYFRAAETEAPWVLRGFQNEIANNGKDSALWHTAGIVDGKMVPGRGWVVTNDEFVEQVRNKDDQWNTTCTAACGDRLVQTLNGFCTSDLIDTACEKTGKLGLQMHGGTDCEMFFKDFEVLPITEDMLKLIERK